MKIFRTKNIKTISDIEIIEKYRSSNNNKYVGVLFERYSHLVYGLCLKYLKNETESKDAVILIFEKLIKDLKSNEITNFSSWLYSVSKNHCLMHLRSKQRLLKREDKYEKEAVSLNSINENPEIELKEEQLTKLEEAILKLKPEQQNCIELFYIKQKRYNEVAEITGYPIKQVKSYIQNGKRNLKLILTSK